jgi:broad specificity phosphatase PhoE
MKRLFYVRHGETEMNVVGLWSGRIETPLTEKGKRQAKEAGQSLKTKLPRVDLIICSPLARAYHTASIIAEEVGYPIDKIQKSPLLLERNFGKLEGTSDVNYYNEQGGLESIDKVEGAETVEQMHTRALEALRMIESLPYDNILIVSHGTFGRAFRRAVDKLPHTHEYIQEHRDAYRLKNAEIVELV